MEDNKESESKMTPGPVVYPCNWPTGMEEMKPEKETLAIDKSKVPADLVDAMKPIFEISKKYMWRWKTFPIVLPQPIMMQNDANLGSGSKKKPIGIKDLFTAPNFNELEAVATDSKGKPKKLSHEQIESIHRSGEFSVDSIEFPGQKHIWRLSNILQKGSDRSTETMHRNFSIAVELFVVKARDFLVGDTWSVKKSINGFSEALMNIFEILIGLPHLQEGNVDDKLQEGRIRFLVCELNSEERANVEEIVAFLRQAKYSESDNQMPKLPFVFFNLRNGKMDLRLHNADLINSLIPTLMKILKTEAEGWVPKAREALISELKKKDVGDKDIEKQVSEKLSEQYLASVCNAIEKEKIIKESGEGVAEVLINQLKGENICQEAVANVKDDISRQVDEEEERLKLQNPICSKIEDWLKRKLSETKSKLNFENQLTAHTKAIEACQKEGLKQHAYFLSRDLLFLKNHQPLLRKELRENMKTPVQTFNFDTRIWFPKNWKVSQRIDNDTKRIPTVIYSKTEDHDAELNNVSNSTFILSKNKVRTISSRNAFWRWKNLFHGVWSCIWNFMFYLGIVAPFCSTFSFRSLVSLEEFYPGYTLSQQTGALYKDPSSRTETLASRLKTLWKHVSTKRKEFEAMPDRGLLGKSVARHINRFNNYFLKGFIGSLLILLFFPASCVLISTVSIILALLSPLLIPPLALIGVVLSVLFCDYVKPGLAILPNLLVNIGFFGILATLISLIIALLICPVCAFIIVVFALIRKCLRQIWDSFLFHLVIKKRGRVPASNTFIAKRIKGPGLASNYFYQVNTEQVLVALEAQMEIEELEAFQTQCSGLINSPLVDYHKFVTSTMKPLSLTVTKGLGGPYQRLATDTTDLLGLLKNKVDGRMKHLQLGLTQNMRERIKLSENELKLALSRGAAMTSGFYPQHVIARTQGGEEKFWERRGLKQNDWVGLTSSLYSTIFTSEFLTPMQEEDTTFQLKVDHWNPSRYLNMVIESDWHDDLDITRAVRSPNKNFEIPDPSLDLALFNPTAKATQNPLDPKPKQEFRWVMVKYQKEPCPEPRSCARLPIPHPAELVLLIHNRDSKAQIGLENSHKIINYLSYGKSKLDEPRESQRRSKQFRNSGKGENEDELEPLKKPEKYLDVNQIV